VGLVFLGLTMVTYLSSGSMAKALMMAIVGLLISYIGTDIVTGRERFTLGIATIAGGFDMVPIAMGLFGISEVLLNLERSETARKAFQTKLRDLLPSRQDWNDSSGPIARGSIMGFFLGIIPGGGGMIPSFISYAMEKNAKARNLRYGDIRGVAGRSRRICGCPGAFIPMLTMGIPCNVVPAILMGALMIHGVTPGPRMLKSIPDILGCRREHVYRKFHASSFEFAPDRDVGPSAQDALFHSLSLHLSFLPHRGLYGREQCPRCLYHAPLWHFGVSDEKVRL
jgi:putative tricarboxylic transport membrane protein